MNYEDIVILHNPNIDISIPTNCPFCQRKVRVELQCNTETGKILLPELTKVLKIDEEEIHE